MTGMLLISAHILDRFRKLRSFRKWDKGMDLNPEDETSYTTQSQEAFLKYMEIEYCAKHRRLLVTEPENILNNNLSPYGMASRSCQSSYDAYDLSSDDEAYQIPNNVIETRPGQNDRLACLLSAVRLSLNSLSEIPQNWGQTNPNVTNYNSDPIEISSTFWLPHITDWWREQEETHSKYADLSNVECDIYCYIAHRVGVEASFSLG
jgi:hypothetical protein